VVSKTGPATATVGQRLTYTIVVRNGGPASAYRSRVADEVPSALTGVSWTCTSTGQAACGSGGGTGNSIGVEVTITAAVENFVTLTVSGTANTAGTISNTATATPQGGQTDTDPGDNSATATTTVAGIATGNGNATPSPTPTSSGTPTPGTPASGTPTPSPTPAPVAPTPPVAPIPAPLRGSIATPLERAVTAPLPGCVPGATVVVTTPPGHGTVAINDDCTYTHTPARGYIGPDSFAYTVSSNGVTQTGQIDISVVPGLPNTGDGGYLPGTTPAGPGVGVPPLALVLATLLLGVGLWSRRTRGARR